jgi:hypothetical protein
MPKGHYPRKKKPDYTPKYEALVGDDTGRINVLERLGDVHIFKPRFEGESIVVKSGIVYGMGATVREAIDNLLTKG